ncbi:UNVERIFIED_CONTAM: surfactin synthase thioesterase subunit [Acetivibrio alkalicellulosi]
MQRINLFCFPYAGASSMIYAKWKNNILKYIDILPVELAGRGRRFNDPFYNSIDEAVDDIYNSIKKVIDESPYALFGHSMGAVIVYELYYKLREHGHNIPEHIFLSGRGPSFKPSEENIHNLKDEEFLKKVMEYGGTPDEVANNKELLDFFLPILRADFKMINLYSSIKRDEKIISNTTVLTGKSDATIKEDIGKWSEYISGEFELVTFDGGHFFIHNNEEKILSIIKRKLS